MAKGTGDFEGAVREPRTVTHRALHRRPDAYIFDTNLWFLPVGVQQMSPVDRPAPMHQPGGPRLRHARSDLRLLRDLQGVIDLDAEVSHGRLQLGVPE